MIARLTQFKRQASRMKVLCSCGEKLVNIKAFWKHQNGRSNHTIQKFRADSDGRIIGSRGNA